MILCTIIIIFFKFQMFKNRHDRSAQDLYEKHSAHNIDDSDSDVEQNMTSSRIESSNHPNKTKLTSECPK